MNQRLSERALERGLKEAWRLIQAGKLADAGDRLQDLSPLDPGNPRLLGLQGIVAMQAGSTDKAAGLLTRALAGDSPAPVRRRNIQALLTLAMSIQSRPLINRAMERPVPTDDADTGLSAEDREILATLVEQLAVIGRLDQALAVLEPFMPQLSDDAGFLELFGALKFAAGKPEEALPPLKAALRQGAATRRLLLNLGAAASQTNDGQTGVLAAQELVARFPLYVSEPKSSQTTTIGIANWSKQRITSNRLMDFHFPGNFISQLARRFPDRYRFVSLLLDSPRALQAAEDAPRPDVLFNAVANAEGLLRLGVKNAIVQRARNWSRCPMINHPDNVRQVRRLSATELYSGLDNWLIPGIARLRKDGSFADIADRIEAEFDLPVIIRGLSEQYGQNMARAETRAELLEAIANVEADPYFYAIQFRENRQVTGLYRKLRAAVAGDTVQIVRVDFDTGWNVHGRSNPAKHQIYVKFPELVREEIEICRDADSYFGSPVMDALRALRSRNPLDVFGIDFDVMPDGRLLFFEANASMLLLRTEHPNNPKGPQEPYDAFMAGFDAYLESLKDRDRQGTLSVERTTGP